MRDFARMFDVAKLLKMMTATYFCSHHRCELIATCDCVVRSPTRIRSGMACVQSSRLDGTLEATEFKGNAPQIVYSIG